MEGSVSGANRGLFAMPREQGGAAAGSHTDEPAVAGMSSFAFQGTNAHALLLTPALPASIVNTPAAIRMPAWQRQYIHVLPPAHVQLYSASVAGAGAAQKAAFVMRLGSQAVHAFFSDHRVSGKAIFPGKFLGVWQGWL